MTSEIDITTSNSYIENELLARLRKLEDVLSGDVITAIVPMFPGVDDIIRSVVESIDDRSGDLHVVLETSGGSIEVVERIADLLRHHYSNGEISFIIPNMAMSAGTVLVMCGDRIMMDYYSVLGPVDPQVRSNTSGTYVPALGYLHKFNELVEKSKAGDLSAAEAAFMIEKFDPAELDQFEKARDLSTDLLEKWLAVYKFKDWTKTESRGLQVDDDMRKKRAKEIGEKLNDTTAWKSHSRGISMQVLRHNLNLIIEDFAEDATLNEAIRSYYRLLQDYLHRRGSEAVVQSREGISLF
ncbi:MAG: serine dehydrogenasease [Pseudomonadota bacterium]